MDARDGRPGRPPRRRRRRVLSFFVDIAIVVAVLGAARSGWRRGFVFYVIDLVGFVGAVLVAVRLHEVPATILGAVGVPESWAPVAGGLVIFVPLIVLVAIVGGRASKAMYRPGLWTTNRVLGAAVAAALAVAIVVVAVLALSASSLPFLPDLVGRSPVASQLVEATGPLVRAVDDGLGLGLCDGALEGAEPCRAERSRETG